MGGPVTIAPLFVLYDYTFLPAGAATKEAGLAQAYGTGVVCADEVMLHPDPYPSREAWCQARLEATERRLAARDPGLPTILVNHFPLIREPTRILRHPEFAQWCGTAATAGWHVRFGAAAVVYGHLHIPRTTWHDGVRFEEVSYGYPREWQLGGRAAAVRTVGVDAEPDHSLPKGVLEAIATADERDGLSALASVAPEPSWDRLLFSAKESVYKAWFPLTRRWLGFEEAVITIDPADGTFTARLLVAGPVLADLRLTGFNGRCLAPPRLVLTPIPIPPHPPLPPFPHYT